MNVCFSRLGKVTNKSPTGIKCFSLSGGKCCKVNSSLGMRIQCARPRASAKVHASDNASLGKKIVGSGSIWQKRGWLLNSRSWNILHTWRLHFWLYCWLCRGLHCSRDCWQDCGVHSWLHCRLYCGLHLWLCCHLQIARASITHLCVLLCWILQECLILGNNTPVDRPEIEIGHMNQSLR